MNKPLDETDLAFTVLGIEQVRRCREKSPAQSLDWLGAILKLTVPHTAYVWRVFNGP